MRTGSSIFLLGVVLTLVAFSSQSISATADQDPADENLTSAMAQMAATF